MLSNIKHGSFIVAGFCFFLSLLIYFERERMSMGEAESEGERESQAGAMLSVEPHRGLKLMNHEIKSWMLNRLCHPGAVIIAVLDIAPFFIYPVPY